MAQILRVSVLGAMPGGEVWSVNPCWEIDGSGGAPVSPAQALTIATALGAITLPSGLTGLMTVSTTQTGYRVEARSLTGTLESQAEFIKATPTPGTGGTAHPYQTSLVLSLRTPGVGPSARGRLYWPATGQALGASDLRLTAGNVTAALTGFKSFLTNMETAIKVTLPNANLTVWSRKTANFHDVNSLQVGNVLDTQRRRRDALIEGYQSGPFP